MAKTKQEINSIVKRKENADIFSKNKQVNKIGIDINDLKQRRSDAKAELNQWRSLLENAYFYALPNYNPWVNNGRGGAITPGQNLDAGLYDLTLHIAHQRLRNKMISNMTPQGQQWLKFVPGESFRDDQGELPQAATDATQRITDQWFRYLDKSGFQTAFAETLDDTLISTGVMAINEGTRKNPWRFEAVPVSHAMIEADPMGGFSAVFRDWVDIKVRHIKQMWPGAKLPHNKEANQKVTLWECSYVDYDADEASRYKYVIMTSGKEVLYEEESPSWPWIIYRMGKLTGESRGRGPTLSAIPTQATINEAIGDELTAAAFQANPMYMAASDSAFNEDTFTAKPGAVIPVQMVMGEYPIQEFPGGGEISFGALVVNDLRQQINQLLFTQPLGAVDSKDRTATEAELRYVENLESFAPIIPRLQHEFFDNVARRTMYLWHKLIPESFASIPQEMLRSFISVDGEILDLNYETPLMTARGQIKTQALVNFFNATAQLLGPELAASAFKPAETISKVAANQGVDVSVIKDKNELQQQFDGLSNVVNEEVNEELGNGESQEEITG